MKHRYRSLSSQCLLSVALALALGTALFSTRMIAAEAGATQSRTFVYFGTFSHASDGGIFVAELNPTTGELSSSEVAAHAESPGFLAIDPKHQRVYALDQATESGATHGYVDSFEIDPATGTLSKTSQQTTTGGAFCYIALDRTQSFLGTARYGDGNAVIFPLDATGRVQPQSSLIQHHGSGPNHERQEAAHVHSINFSPDNRFAIVADLGIDEIRAYRFDSKEGTLELPDSPQLHTTQGAGPRHFAFHPDGTHAYAVCEVDATVLALSYDPANGTLKTLQTLPLLPSGTTGEQRAAEVVVHPSGHYVYVSNRGYDALVVYSVDPKTGLLSFVQREHDGISYPRNFAIDPTGRWLLCANRDANTVTVYAIDADTGRLTPTAFKTAVPQPVCVRFYSTN